MGEAAEGLAGLDLPRLPLSILEDYLDLNREIAAAREGGGPSVSLAEMRARWEDRDGED